MLQATLFALDGFAPRPHLAARLGYALVVDADSPRSDAEVDPEAEARWAAVIGPTCTVLFLHACDLCGFRWAVERWMPCDVVDPEPEAGDLVVESETEARCATCRGIFGDPDDPDDDDDDDDGPCWSPRSPAPVADLVEALA